LYWDICFLAFAGLGVFVYLRFQKKWTKPETAAKPWLKHESIGGSNVVETPAGERGPRELAAFDDFS
jgi:hypothetical protein